MFPPAVCLSIRRVWGSVLGHDEESRARRGDRRDQDLEAGLLREAEAGLLERGQHYGAVLAPEYHPPGGSCHQM